MPVNLSIKGVPDELAAGLRARAARHHRSLQGELMAILEEAVAPTRHLSAAEVFERVRDLGLATGDEAVAMVRSDRDAR
jgi:plasmid stability protein